MNRILVVMYFIIGFVIEIIRIALNDENNSASNKLTLMKYVKKNYGQFDTGQNEEDFRGYHVFEKGNYFYAEKKFSEAELNFAIVEFAAKSAIMASYSLYGINFYSEALDNLERYLKKYPADKNVMYAHYLVAIIYYEQISDEKKDLQPLLDANAKIDFFMKYASKSYDSIFFGKFGALRFQGMFWGQNPTIWC